MLIANRGEIAVRIIRTCRAPRHRDRAGRVRGRPRLAAGAAARIAPSASGRRARRTAISRWRRSCRRRSASAPRPSIRATAFSPNVPRSRACARQHGVVFIGPTAAQIEAVGDKLRARAAAEAAGVPVVPGRGGALRDAGAASWRARIGVPLLVKAVGGGGGRGMKLRGRARSTCRRRSSWRRPKRGARSVTRASTWSATWRAPGTSRCRCSAMAPGG